MNTREYNDIIAECRRFARKEIRPLAPDLDLSPDPENLQAVWEKSAFLDLPVLLIPEEAGGAGYPELCAALVLDTLAAECAGTASMFACHWAAWAAIRQSKNKKIINSLAAAAPTLLTLLLPDKREESTLDLSGTKETFVLSGASPVTGNAGMAHGFIVFVPGKEGNQHFTLTAIPASRAAPVIDHILELPGVKANAFARIRFQDQAVESDWIEEDPQSTAAALETARRASLGFVAAMAMGVARAALEKATAYARQRYQYGQKIIFHQEIQKMLGAMQMKLGLGTAGYLSLFDSRPLQLSSFPADAGLVKAFCTDAALEIVLDAIQIHGGYGYMHEYDLEKMMRDVKMLQLLGGQNPFHQIRAVEKSL